MCATRRRAGCTPSSAATGLGIWLILAGLVLCAAIAPPLLPLIGAADVARTLSHTPMWREMLVLGILAIAGGFVLRAVGAGVAAPVTVSRWFLLVVVCAAFFVASAKRYAELRRADGERDPRRRVLSSYSPQLLEPILADSAAVALFAYSVCLLDADDITGRGEAIARAFGGTGEFDVVVLGLGAPGAQTGLDAQPVEAPEVMGVNFLVGESLLLSCLRRMRHREEGTLVVLSTVAVERPRAANAIYGAAKPPSTRSPKTSPTPPSRAACASS